MSDKKTRFLEITERLKQALQLPSDLRLAGSLGLKQSTWSTSKTRGSLPKVAIDALLEREGISPEYIYNGTGRVYLEDDGHSWHSGLVKRLQHLALPNTHALLVREGHKAADIKAAAAGKQAPSMELLRDWRRISNVDLNWVISGDATEQPNDEEQALLALYRKATPDRQKAILAALVVASTKFDDDVPAQKPRIKQRAGAQSQQIAGDVSGPIVFAPNNKTKTRSKK